MISEEHGKIRTIRIHEDLNRSTLVALSNNLICLGSSSELIIDLSEAGFAGTDFINLLVELKHRFPDDYKKIILLNPNENICEILKLTNLDQIFKVQNSRLVLETV